MVPAPNGYEFLVGGDRLPIRTQHKTPRNQRRLISRFTQTAKTDISIRAWQRALRRRVTLFTYAYSAVSDCIDKVLQTVCDGDQQLQEQ
jgi:hypothetical protein